MDAKIAKSRRTVRQTSAAPQALLSSSLSLDELLSSVALRDVQSTVASINDTLLQAALVESVAELQVLAFPLRRSLSALETAPPTSIRRSGSSWPPESRSSGASSPDPTAFSMRARASSTSSPTASACSPRTGRSRVELTEAVSSLVDGAKQDIGKASLEAHSVQRFSLGIVIAAVALSLTSSTLIVWLYVDRNLIARLTRSQGQHAGDCGREPASEHPGPGERRAWPHGSGADRLPRHGERGRGGEPQGDSRGAGAAHGCDREHLGGLLAL